MILKLTSYQLNSYTFSFFKDDKSYIGVMYIHGYLATSLGTCTCTCVSYKTYSTQRSQPAMHLLKFFWGLLPSFRFIYVYTSCLVKFVILVGVFIQVGKSIISQLYKMYKFVIQILKLANCLSIVLAICPMLLSPYCA